MARTAIRCSCGQRIGQREVMHAGYYPRPFGPSLVLVRYRCSRCRRLGEQFVRQEEWESGILRDSHIEVPAGDRGHFASMGPIEMSEQADFHQELNRDDLLADLNREFQR